MLRLLSSNAVRLAMFYAAFCVVIGTVQPFWPLWLKAKGLDATEIGVVLAIGVGAKVIGLPIAAHLADRSGQRQRLMLLLAALSVLAFGLFAIADGFWALVLVSLVFFALWPPVMSMGESLTIMAARDGTFQYGRVRLWGSVGFIGTALAAGAILERVPAEAVYWMILGGVVLTMLACGRLPDLRAEKSLSRHPPVLDLLRRRSFVLMLTACGLIQGSHAVYYAFGTIHWRQAGYSEALIGALWAEGVVCEVALFAFGAAAVRRAGAVELIVLAGAAAVLRWLGTGLTDALLPIVALQALHGLSFGAAHLGAMHWMSSRLPSTLSATAQSLYSAVVFGAFLGALLYASGWLYGSFGGFAFLPMALIGLAGAACAVRLMAGERAIAPVPRAARQP